MSTSDDDDNSGPSIDNGKSTAHDVHDTAGHSDGSHVDAGNDLFTFGDTHGNAHASTSANWSDVIEMDINDDLTSGHSGTWTEEIDGQKIVDGHVPDKLDTDTGKGHSDHSDIDTHHIDKLHW
ncbi:hypothetical protein AYR66_18810 [Noviherbaspirillum denitrificans]|uniref:Uncharacterized protein n=2 Tax=Noviherbaspirillum denitrificans TaxID=1968433 RepID=A0A254TEX8_9BURK|nr:hypothetical protein AYR66_18810 [Noviherbaspirillum denitrificans]